MAALRRRHSDGHRARGWPKRANRRWCSRRTHSPPNAHLCGWNQSSTRFLAGSAGKSTNKIDGDVPCCDAGFPPVSSRAGFEQGGLIRDNGASGFKVTSRGAGRGAEFAGVRRFPFSTSDCSIRLWRIIWCGSAFWAKSGSSRPSMGRDFACAAGRAGHGPRFGAWRGAVATRINIRQADQDTRSAERSRDEANEPGTKVRWLAAARSCAA